jgi:DNA-binding transcriptional MocR family regulator
MTKPLKQFSKAELAALENSLNQDFELVAANKMALNLSRGKPAPDQLALSNGLEQAIAGNFIAADGTDTRNYGDLRGLTEARELGAELLGVPASTVIAGGNSSLFLMHLVFSKAMQAGLWGDNRRWSSSSSPKVLTPVPGYDRHFTLSESLGAEMINIEMTEQGPDLDQIKALVSSDDSIKAIWCVPKYSNPTGCIYSDETVAELAALPAEAAADDFVVLWDNAYAVHDLVELAGGLASIYEAALRADTLDHVVQFASTSKITFAGSGIAFVSSGDTVLQTLEDQLSAMIVGPDKVNQLRHSRFLAGRVKDHMHAHAKLLRPKFDLVEQTLTSELADLQIASWTHPAGGYFVSLDLQPGLAKSVVEMAGRVGLTLTPAGATFPHGQDPLDRNVRIAPTYANLEDLRAAMQILALCVKLASVKQLLNT